jgi:phosphopantetheine adenylyltransferase
MHLRELFLNEDDRSTAVFAFGRFNPPTIGHEKLIQKVQSMPNRSMARVTYSFHTQENTERSNRFPNQTIIPETALPIGQVICHSGDPEQTP